MKLFDWIVVGAGITGASLSYELAKQGFSVLLLERDDGLRGSTRFGYGGLAYWSGTTDLTRQICAEGKAIHQTLSEELEADTQLRELDLVLTIAPDADPEVTAQSYAHFADPPRLVSVEEACDLEPLLNPQAIAGALTVKHGHIAPEVTAHAYTQAFVRLGGDVHVAPVTGLLRNQAFQVTGVICGEETYSCANVVICAGALSRALLKESGIPLQLYFTHAELVETPPVEITLRTLVMPANTQRFQLEADASRSDLDSLWDEPGHEPAPYILDAGAIQLQNGSLRIGQVSRVLTNPKAPISAQKSEAEIRARVGTILPALENLPGRWHHCLIAFSRDRLPLVGAIPGTKGIHVFSGFSNPLAIVPALARRFAQNAAGTPDQLIAQLSPGRFGKSC